NSIEPLMSANNAVTVLRSPSGTSCGAPTRVAAVSASAVGRCRCRSPAAASPPRAAPQAPQNFSPGSFGAPHTGHGAPSAAPHSAQKRRSARLSWLQDGQCIAVCLGYGDYHAGHKPLNSAPGRPSALRNQAIRPRCPPSGSGHGAPRQAPAPQLTPERLPESDPQQLLPTSLLEAVLHCCQQLTAR